MKLSVQIKMQDYILACNLVINADANSTWFRVSSAFEFCEVEAAVCRLSLNEW